MEIKGGKSPPPSIHWCSYMCTHKQRSHCSVWAVTFWPKWYCAMHFILHYTHCTFVVKCLTWFLPPRCSTIFWLKQWAWPPLCLFLTRYGQWVRIIARASMAAHRKWEGIYSPSDFLSSPQEELNHPRMTKDEMGRSWKLMSGQLGWPPGSTHLILEGSQFHYF